ncbi:hypothetical protein PAXINDRAFT_152361 [Paxillus involutus ATCC 200175]|nr:hypothetical protein PAXINDRAFT_152361 [Paxillus involutus ATCC 200175]
MIRNPTASKLRLPVEDTPDGEIDSSDHEATELKTTAERLETVASYFATREKWLRTTFPKFSSRGRGGKQPDVVPPPHTIHNRGRCTLQIGPHAFIDTTVFEVHYHPVPVAVAPSTTFVHQSTPAGHQTGSQPTTSSTPSSVSTAEPSNPLLSSLASTISVPPALISQVNVAAASNPTLANLLQLAASGRALPDQLKTLGLLIQSLANSPAMDITPAPPQTGISTTDSKSTLPTAPAVASQYQYQTPVKDFDIVLEFREAPSERWIFPRGPATCEFTPASESIGSIGDITLSTIVPFAIITPSPGPETSVAVDIIPKQAVVFQFKMASSFIWDSFSRWVGPKEKMEQNRSILGKIEPLERKYLTYRLPEGSQLAQIQNVPLSPQQRMQNPSEGSPHANLHKTGIPQAHRPQSVRGRRNLKAKSLLRRSLVSRAVKRTYH